MFQCLKNCKCLGEEVIDGFEEGENNLKRKKIEQKPEISKDTTQVSNGPGNILNPEEKTIDQEFPPTEKSLNYKKGSHRITWRRLSHLFPASTIGSVQGVNNLQQGNPRDSYFLAAIVAIGKDWIRIQRMFSFDMTIKQLYKFTVYQEGVPHSVVIDDFIPVLENQEPVFYKPKTEQIWVGLLEKLWAKVCGSYGNMFHKTPLDVFQAFLPAPSIHHPMSTHPWAEMSDSHQLNVPICLNTRPSTSTPLIKPAQSYTLNSINSQTLQLNNLSYLNHYTGKYENIGVYPSQNQYITLTWEEVKANFDSVDICYERNGFTFSVGKTKSCSSKEKYFQLEVKEQGEVYLTVRKTNSQKKQESKYLRMLLFRKDDYEYIDAKFSTTECKITTYYKKLKPGKYTVIVEGSSKNLFQQKTVSLCAYSKCPCSISDSNQPEQNPLHKIFQTHARSASYKLKEEDWTTSKFFERQSGYAYIAIKLSTPVKYKVNVVCEIRKIQESGFILLEEEQGPSVEINLSNSNSFAILVFSINFHHYQPNLHFPPKGVKITKFF